MICMEASIIPLSRRFLGCMHARTNERAPLPLNERYTILDKLPYKSNGDRDCLPFTKTLCNTGKKGLECSMLLLLCLGHAFLTPIEIVCTFIQRWTSVTQLQQSRWWCACMYAVLTLTDSQLLSTKYSRAPTHIRHTFGSKVRVIFTYVGAGTLFYTGIKRSEFLWYCTRARNSGLLSE
jgi:hypothetical protein